MLFSERDIALLYLICWCQYIQPEDLSGFAASIEIENLACLGLVRRHKTSGALVLSNRGMAFLSELYQGALPNLTRSYHGDAIQRRLRRSKLALTAYRAHINIFTTTVEELSRAPSLFLSAVSRSRGSNPWGSTRVAALAHLGDTFYAIHYVCPDIGRLALADELSAFMNQTARFSDSRRALLFAGETYQDILTELEGPPSSGDSKLISYGDACRCLQLPVHLLSCDDTGAIQLQIMSAQDYRTKLTRAALKAQYCPPPEEVTVWDALFQNQPFVMAADMDLRRVDAALRTAQENGYPRIALAALEGQAEAVFYRRYRDTGKARVFVLTDSALTAALGRPPEFYTPPRTQFLTQEGDVVDAPPFKASGKAGGLA